MTADLKAAIEWARCEVAKRERQSSQATTVLYTVRHQAAANHLSFLLTAQDQAAEALKPFAVNPHPSHADDDNFMSYFKAGQLRRAATVYAALKPADTKEGEGT